MPGRDAYLDGLLARWRSLPDGGLEPQSRWRIGPFRNDRRLIRRAFQHRQLAAELLQFPLEAARGLPPFALPQPRRQTADQNADDQQKDDERKQRQRHRRGGRGAAKRVERNRYVL